MVFSDPKPDGAQRLSFSSPSVRASVPPAPLVYTLRRVAKRKKQACCQGTHARRARRDACCLVARRGKITAGCKQADLHAPIRIVRDVDQPRRAGLHRDGEGVAELVRARAPCAADRVYVLALLRQHLHALVVLVTDVDQAVAACSSERPALHARDECGGYKRARANTKSSHTLARVTESTTFR